MKRKLVKQAGQAMTVTLPIEWIRENRLKAKDEVNIEHIENSIIITSSNKVKTGKAELDFRGWEPGKIRIYLKALFALGIDEIDAASADDFDLYEFMGYAVTEHQAGRLKIRDISGTSIENVDDMFKRVLQMLIAFYDKAISNMFEEKNQRIESIKKAEIEINKFTLFLERAIMKHAYADSYSGKLMFAYAFSLEQIGDEIFRLWQAGTNRKFRTKDAHEIVLLSKKSVEKVFELMYQFNDKKIVDIRKIKVESRERIAKIRGIDNATAEVVARANRIIEECADLNQLILMLKLSGTVDRK